MQSAVIKPWIRTKFRHPHIQSGHGGREGVVAQDRQGIVHQVQIGQGRRARKRVRFDGVNLIVERMPARRDKTSNVI